ncbi:MAG: response regulator transcription factor [Alphaproteobacteria bacterium]|nr:response regulator transcription factor [Alphaproteobacteria bacterium]
MKRIILADDHEVVRAGLRDALVHIEPDIEVLEADSLDAALKLGDEDEVALVLLDLNMPGMDGVGGVERMLAKRPEVPVAVVSGSVRRRDMASVMAVGAAGFLPKSMKLDAMASAVRLLLAGERYLPYEFMAEESGRERPDGGLTPRELEILEAIGEGKPNKQIARELEIEEVTVKLHATNLFRKLEVSNRTEAAMKGRELGLI